MIKGWDELKERLMDRQMLMEHYGDSTVKVKRRMSFLKKAFAKKMAGMMKQQKTVAQHSVIPKMEQLFNKKYKLEENVAFTTLKTF